MFLSILAAAAATLLGSTYDTAIKGTVHDPVEVSTNTDAIEEFQATLNGPQNPGVRVEIDGRDLIVFETCMEMLCSEQHAVIAIDIDTHEQYSAVYTIDGTKHVLVDAPFGDAIDAECADVACYLEGGAQKGPFINLNTLTQDDLKGLPGGAFCAAYDTDNDLVLYTEGLGRMWWNGRLRVLSEDGIGTDEIYTDDDYQPLVIKMIVLETLETGYEMVRQSAMLNVFDGEWYTTPVIVRCES